MHIMVDYLAITFTHYTPSKCINAVYNGERIDMARKGKVLPRSRYCMELCTNSTSP